MMRAKKPKGKGKPSKGKGKPSKGKGKPSKCPSASKIMDQAADKYACMCAVCSALLAKLII